MILAPVLLFSRSLRLFRFGPNVVEACRWKKPGAARVFPASTSSEVAAFRALFSR